MDILFDIEWYFYPLLILAGFLAGLINTVAGSGSVVTLSLLSMMGMPSTIANGTNRVGVFVQSLVGYRTYQKNAPFDWQKSRSAIFFTTIGAILGTQIAVSINDLYLDYTIGVLMIGILMLILLKPKDWLRTKTQENQSNNKLINAVLFFGVGIYGGFIQAGVGVIMLSALVLGLGYHLQRANAVKVLIVLVYTIPSLLMFWYNGQIEWISGIFLAVGQSGGAYVSASLATKYPNANVWIRRLLIVIVLISIFRFLHLTDLLF